MAGLFSLDGRMALVTGSGQGIGRAIAEALAQAGAHVVLNGRDQAKLDIAARELRAKGFKVSTAAFDVSDIDRLEAAVTKVEADVGAIDILVNNAGIQRRNPILDFTRADWDAVMTTNVDALFFLTKAVAKGMVARKRGKVINICSVMSHLGRQTISAYTASKGAVKLLTQAMCAEWGRHNVQVNGIGPGYFVTEINKALLANAEFTAWVEARTPAARWGETAELGGAAVFLASDASNYVNGHVLMVDGGLTAVV